MSDMKEPRDVLDFPKTGNHVGDVIRLPSGQVYEWLKLKHWQRNFLYEKNSRLILTHC